jgi:hypothetical protein
MSFKFSPDRRNELIIYFQKYYDLNISDEQADEWLDSLVNLFDCFAEKR